MKPPHYYDLMMMMMNSNCVFEKYEDEGDLLEAYAELFEATEILNQSYKKVIPSKYANERDNMWDEKPTKFQAILERYKVLVDGELGLYLHEKFRLKLKKGAVSVHTKSYPYPVSHTRQVVFC